MTPSRIQSASPGCPWRTSPLATGRSPCTGCERRVQGSFFSRECRVQHPELLDEDPERPAVGDDVVSRDQESMFISGPTEEPEPCQRPLAQVEWSRGISSGLFLDMPYPVSLGAASFPGLDERDQTVGPDHLHGLPAFNRDRGSQTFMAFHDLAKCLLERNDVQGAPELVGQGDVMDRVTILERLELPETALPGRQRHSRFRAQFLLQEPFQQGPFLDRREIGMIVTHRQATSASGWTSGLTRRKWSIPQRG